MKLKERLTRNPCKECFYYVKENNLCQSKKCSVQGGSYPFVTKLDRMFCEPYKREEERMENDNYSVNKVDANYIKKLNDTKDSLESFKKKIALLESTTEAIDFAIELIDREINAVMWVNEITK